MDPKDSLKQLVEVMIKALVDYPDKVSVDVNSGEQTVIFEVTTLKEDRGKVIGKQGRTAKSLRTILSGASTKLKKRSVLQFVED